RAIKCNPDSPQKFVRLLALKQGKIVYVAVPRLRELRCFLELNPKRISSAGAAATIGGAAEQGRPVHPKDMPKIDLVVCGSVAIDRHGNRIGKGGGYSDLEFAIGRELGFIGPSTPIVTTVHPIQLVEGTLPVTSHDFSVDLAAMPEEVRRFERGRRPRGILRSHLTASLVESVPILRELGYR
ncbi:MAG TPA: 5-formyltetrahydrofolate cyclo-ligase, partial [Myxococcaceae bacterium]|nr:5-formyltetrahydrofolate cyclo-ligase [Myxococcaceae bacterium]